MIQQRHKDEALRLVTNASRKFGVIQDSTPFCEVADLLVLAGVTVIEPYTFWVDNEPHTALELDTERCRQYLQKRTRAQKAFPKQKP